MIFSSSNRWTWGSSRKITSLKDSSFCIYEKSSCALLKMFEAIILQRFGINMISLTVFFCNTHHKVLSEWKWMLKTLHNNFHRPLRFKATVWEFITKRPSYISIYFKLEVFPPSGFIWCKVWCSDFVYVHIHTGLALRWGCCNGVRNPVGRDWEGYYFPFMGFWVCKLLAILSLLAITKYHPSVSLLLQ